MQRKPTGKGLAAIYRQEIIQDVTLFTSQSAAAFYDKLFSSLDFTLPGAATGRRGFPKEAMVCAFIVMKCEGFTQITDLMDYLDNNRLIAHYCGFNIMEPLPSYWTYAKSKFSKENHPKSDPDCALGVHSASNQHNERRYAFYWGYKSHVLVDCISGLPLYELTTPANIMDSTVAVDILAAANQILPLQGCSFLADKGYDAKSIYNTVKSVYDGGAFIPLKKRNSKSKALPAGNLICDAGLAMHKDGKTTDNNRTRQKFCCPFRQSKTGVCPCNHKNWNNGKKNRGCVKYRIVPTDYRLSIDRSCLYFKRTYALRTECERYNSRFKSTGQERLWVRNGSSAANLNTLAHISALAVALAAVLHGSHSYRSAKQLRRSA